MADCKLGRAEAFDSLDLRPILVCVILVRIIAIGMDGLSELVASILVDQRAIVGSILTFGVGLIVHIRFLVNRDRFFRVARRESFNLTILR